MSAFNDLEELDNQLLHKKEEAEEIIEKRIVILQNMNPDLKQQLDYIDKAYLAGKLKRSQYIKEREEIVSIRTKFKHRCLEQDLGLLDQVISVQKYLYLRKKLLEDFYDKIPINEINEADIQYLNATLSRKDYLKQRMLMLKKTFRV